jgi:hypothetical protein
MTPGGYQNSLIITVTGCGDEELTGWIKSLLLFFDGIALVLPSETAESLAVMLLANVDAYECLHNARLALQLFVPVGMKFGF